MRNAFIAELTELAEDERLITLLADNGIIVYDEYARRRPKQLLNLGIAESNLIAMAAGMAGSGFIPFVYSIIPFLVMRPYEFVRDDICYQNRNVKLVGIGAGYAYSTLGPTHHGTEDVSILSCLPNLTILSPADPLETRQATRAAHEHEGPVYLRIGTGRNPDVLDGDSGAFTIGRARLLREGSDLAILSHGTILSEVLVAAKQLERQGISTRVLNMHSLSPLDSAAVVAAAKEIGTILTVEEHSIFGGLGSLVATTLMESQCGDANLKLMGLKRRFCESYGSVEDLRKELGLLATDIARAGAELARERAATKQTSRAAGAADVRQIDQADIQPAGTHKA